MAELLRQRDSTRSDRQVAIDFRDNHKSEMMRDTSTLASAIPKLFSKSKQTRYGFLTRYVTEEGETAEDKSLPDNNDATAGIDDSTGAPEDGGSDETGDAVARTCAARLRAFLRSKPPGAQCWRLPIFL